MDLGEVLGAKVKVTPLTILEDEATDNVILDNAPEEVIEPEVIDDSIEPENGFMSAEDAGATIVNMLDGLQSCFLPYLREKKIFTDRELELLQTIDTTGATPYPLNSPENTLLAKWKRHQEILKKIPFSDGEKSRLINATTLYAGQTNLKITPLQGLLMSFSEVVLQRGAMFFYD